MATRVNLELENGDVVEIELNYNPMKCMKIATDFPQVNETFTMVVGESKQDISIQHLSNAVYVAYRQANMNDYMSYEMFSTAWVFDMTEAMGIYYGMLDKNARSKYLERLETLGKK